MTAGGTWSAFPPRGALAEPLDGDGGGQVWEGGLNDQEAKIEKDAAERAAKEAHRRWPCSTDCASCAPQPGHALTTRHTRRARRSSALKTDPF